MKRLLLTLLLTSGAAIAGPDPSCTVPSWLPVDRFPQARFNPSGSIAIKNVFDGFPTTAQMVECVNRLNADRKTSMYLKAWADSAKRFPGQPCRLWEIRGKGKPDGPLLWFVNCPGK